MARQHAARQEDVTAGRGVQGPGLLFRFLSDVGASASPRRGIRPAANKLAVGTLGVMIAILGPGQPPGAHAHDEDTVIGNHNVGVFGRARASRMAVAFTTGADRYKLSAIGVELAKAGSTRNVQVRLLNDDDGSPGSVYTTWKNTHVVAEGVNKTSPDSSVGDDATLAANTKYWIQIRQWGSGTLNQWRSVSSTAPPIAKPGWSLGRDLWRYTGGDWAVFIPSYHAKVRLWGHRIDFRSTGSQVVSSPERSGTYRGGEEIEVDVSFDHAVDLTGHDATGKGLDLWIDDNSSQAYKMRYKSGSGTNRLRFGYVVQGQNRDRNGPRIGTQAFSNLGNLRANGHTSAVAASGNIAERFAGDGHKINGRLPRGKFAKFSRRYADRASGALEGKRRGGDCCQDQIINIGAPVRIVGYADWGGEIEYSLESLDARTTPRDGWFTIEADTGQIQTATRSTHRVSAYRVRVTATEEISGENTSQIVWINRGNSVRLPGEPRNLTASTGAAGVSLRWDAPTDPGRPGPITGYRIDHSDTLARLGRERWRWSVLVADTGSTATSYLDTTAPKEQTRRYRVRARSAAGAGTHSDWVSGRRLYGPQIAEIGVATREVRDPTTEGLSVRLIFPPHARIRSTPSPTLFRVTVNGRNNPVVASTGRGTLVTITTAPVSIGDGERIELHYTDPDPTWDDSWVPERTYTIQRWVRDSNGDPVLDSDGNYTYEAADVVFGGRTVSGPQVLENSAGADASSFCLTIDYGEGTNSAQPPGAFCENSPATRTQVPGRPALTGQFLKVPARHNGEDDVKFELKFSEPLHGEFSYRTLQGTKERASAIRVTNGSVKRVWRIKRNSAGRNQHWGVRITPNSRDAAIAVQLGPERRCELATSICTADGEPLSKLVGATIAATPVADRPPLTVRYTMYPPRTHDGKSWRTLEIAFSANLATTVTAETIRDAFDIERHQSGTDHSITPRVSKGRGFSDTNNRPWIVSFLPGGPGQITVRIPATTGCGAANAICTPDGRPSGALETRTIVGPPSLRIEDATAAEFTIMRFSVTLMPAASEAVTMDYRTESGTATPSLDYRHTTGSLTFAAGETSKTISVQTWADGYDDDGEQFTLILSGVSGGNVYQERLTATGTITNTGPLPQGWIARLGRTLARQAVDVFGGRVAGRAANHVQVGGISLNAAGGPEREADDPGLGIDDLAWNPVDRTQTMTARDLLLGSAFSLGAAGVNGTPAVGAWGRFELGGFETEDDELALDGDVTTGFLGADVGRDRWLAGLGVSFSKGDGEYRSIESGDSGTIESSLTSFYPYARWTLTERVDVWGFVGFGSGELTLEREMKEREATRYSTDIVTRMGALGVRGKVLAPTEPGGLSVAIRSDAFWVRTKSDEVRSENGWLSAAEGEASRVRIIVEGSRAFHIGNGTLTPSAELGIRHDGGDAEPGSGLEVGGALGYARAGFQLEGTVRTLVAHEESGYREWGAAGALRIRPGASGRGVALTIAPSFGTPGSGTAALWSARDARALVPAGGFRAGRQLEAEIGYGLGLPRAPGLVTPYAGLSLGGGGSRTWRAGARWRVEPVAWLGIEAMRREADREAEPAHGIAVRARARW